MREKELRLALVCYGGISLAVYMHGITKELWRLARASRAWHAGESEADSTESIYARMLDLIADATGTRMRVLIDIIAGASAGGINGVFLGHAIATGRPLDPLTDLWLNCADVDELLDPDARPISAMSKFWATPIAHWMAKRPGGTIDRTVDVEERAEVRAKLSRFVRARWFEPPFGGEVFSNLLLDALDAMDAAPAGRPLLPPGHPLDLFVTVTDYHGHPERLRLHSPPETVETEHRLTLSFTDHGQMPRRLGDGPELIFAARATASFPGAFPPFRVSELDAVLAGRAREWPERDAFLARILPRHAAVGSPEDALLIDGSVLANAPFRPAIDALRDRPARREVDRRFVYIDPKPGHRSISLARDRADLPGFFSTILAALSDIPRTQPIRDNLEAIEGRSHRIRRMQAIVEAIQPEVETEIEASLGRTFFLDRPTAARLRGWRAKAQTVAARKAGFAYASYGHLKLSGIVEEVADLLAGLAGEHALRQPIRDALWQVVQEDGLTAPGACSSAGASDAVILFFRQHDLGFRIRRLRGLTRLISVIGDGGHIPADQLQPAHDAAYRALAPYLDRHMHDFYQDDMIAAARDAVSDPRRALELLADARNLKLTDDLADDLLADALGLLPKAERRRVLFAYLGFPFYDIGTLPLLQGEGQDEFDEIKVDRISPDDATAIRSGGAETTLKGIRFNSFGAFFSRAYRENDYLWGRLHGVDRLIDIVLSALTEGKRPAPEAISALKRDAFRLILAEERERLGAIPGLFAALDREVG